jgi:hypothetical protein
MTIARRLGERVDCGGLFRTRLDVPAWSRGPPVWRHVAGAVAGWFQWLRRRRRSSSQNYIVLAATDATLVVFEAGLAADDVGAEVLRCSMKEVAAHRLGSWDVDLVVNGTSLNLTCVICDRSSMQLMDMLAPGQAM